MGKVYCTRDKPTAQLPVSRGNIFRRTRPYHSYNSSDIFDFLDGLDTSDFRTDDGSLDTFEGLPNSLKQSNTHTHMHSDNMTGDTHRENRFNFPCPMSYKLHVFINHVADKPTEVPGYENNLSRDVCTTNPTNTAQTLTFDSRLALLSFRRKITSNTLYTHNSKFESSSSVQYTTHVCLTPTAHKKTKQRISHYINKRHEQINVLPVDYDAEKYRRAYIIAQHLERQGLRLKFAILDSGASCNLWKHASDLTNINWHDRHASSWEVE